MPSALENLATKVGSLKPEKFSQAEFDGLLRSGKRRLADAQNSDLSYESRFDLAYNASHALGLAALRWHGYRPENRFIVFQCLTHTLEIAPEKWRVLDLAHTKRNAAEYDGDLEVSEALLAAMIAVAEDMLRRCEALDASASN
jgi:hypothetical protein